MLHGRVHKWGGIENGALLAQAASNGFDALVTKDANLQYEQNLVAMAIAVVVLRAASNDIDDIKPLIPALISALKTLAPKCVTQILTSL